MWFDLVMEVGTVEESFGYYPVASTICLQEEEYSQHCIKSEAQEASEGDNKKLNWNHLGRQTNLVHERNDET